MPAIFLLVFYFLLLMVLSTSLNGFFGFRNLSIFFNITFVSTVNCFIYVASRSLIILSYRNRSNFLDFSAFYFVEILLIGSRAPEFQVLVPKTYLHDLVSI